MFDIYTVIALVLGYLFGSIPFALVIGKVFYKTDIRNFGSGNLGGTNAGRVLGRPAGAAVSILDVLKAAIVVAIVYQFKPEVAALAGVAATLGHIYPIFANFKGGKAVSTAYGYLLAVSIFITHQFFIMFLFPWLLFFAILKVTKYVSFSSMTALSVGVITAFIVSDIMEVNFYILLIVSVVIYRHKANIKRLLNKEESKVTWI